MGQINLPSHSTYPAQGQSQVSKAQSAESASEIGKGAAELGKAIAEAAKEAKGGEAHAAISTKDTAAQVAAGKAANHIDLGELMKEFNPAKDALKLADEMTATSRKDPAKLAEQVMKFDKTVDKMDRDELMDVAHGLTDRLKEGKGDNQLLGTLLQRVLSEVDERGSHSILEKLKPFPLPEPTPLPWPKHVPGWGGKGPLPILMDDVKPQHFHDKMMVLDAEAKQLE